MKINNQKEFGKLVSTSLFLILGVSVAVTSFIGILILLIFYLSL